MHERLVIAVLLLAFALSTDARSQRRLHPAYNDMIDAAEAMRSAEQVIYRHKLSRGLFDSLLDPNRTGLMGIEYSRITTTIGSLKAKRTAANPDFAALIVRELSDHGFTSLDSVVVTMTGSFPGLNLAVISALETLQIPSLWICSLGASSYGANQEDFTWLDVEDVLKRAGLLSRTSDLVTLGGTGDVGSGLPKGGKTILRRNALRLGYRILESTSFEKQARRRRQVLGSPEHYSLLINIGGNQAMLGKGGRELPGGWIDPATAELKDGDGDDMSGIVFDFLAARVPVLNLLHVEDIAKEAGIPLDPVPFPGIGESAVYYDSKSR